MRVSNPAEKQGRGPDLLLGDEVAQHLEHGVVLIFPHTVVCLRFPDLG